MSDRILKYTEALREATAQMLAENDQVFVIGLGVPQGAAGTTMGLKDEYPTRVLDTPISEGALTGLAVGAAISGLHPVVYHERVEFALVAADQIFTQAAKWNYMFGGDNPVPLTLRVAVGRKWGNGPQHSQALYSLFGAVRGLKVVIASTPYMAKGLLISAIRDKNPVILLENLWLYQVKEEVPEKMYALPLDKARVAQEGTDVTVVTYGDGFVDSLSALTLLPKDISVELIDLVSINPVDYDTIEQSVRKTGRLITVDTTNAAFSVGAEIIAKMTERAIPLSSTPIAIATPDVPVPTSSALLEFYYPTKVDIANAVLKMLNKEALETKLSFEELHLAPSHTL
ncbi:MAG: transketolase C-terminal domain-containing protein [Patescibacteria group bacterium]